MFPRFPRLLCSQRIPAGIGEWFIKVVVRKMLGEDVQWDPLKTQVEEEGGCSLFHCSSTEKTKGFSLGEQR